MTIILAACAVPCLAALYLAVLGYYESRGQVVFTELSPVDLDRIVVNCSYEADGKSVSNAVSVRDHDDLLTIVAILQKAEKREGICGCMYYTIALHYKDGTEILLDWPHGGSFENGWNHYYVSEIDLRTIWDIFVKHGVDPRAVPSG